MKTVEIYFLSTGEVIRIMAEIMETSYSHHGREYFVEIPQSWGIGSISALQFEGGFGLLKYDCLFYERLEIHFLKRDIQPLKFLYCLDGHFKVRFENEDEFYEMKKYHSMIVASQGRNGHVFSFPAGERIKVRNIEIDRRLFKQRFDWQSVSYDSQLQHIFEDFEANEAFSHDGMYSVKLSDLFKKLDGNPLKGITRSVFMEGLALEILSEQLSLYEDDLNGHNFQGILREYELSCIDEASKIIRDELEEVDTIPGLSRRIGLNINKLQEGFKIQYKMTVNQYIHSIRLKRATELLRNTNYNISEIVTKVGLSSKSYFSQIFKDAYGVTPSGYRKQKTKRSEELTDYIKNVGEEE